MKGCRYCQTSKPKRYPAWHCSCCARHLPATAMHYIMDERGPLIWCAACHDSEQSTGWWWRRRPVVNVAGSRAWVHTWLQRPFTDWAQLEQDFEGGKAWEQ